MGSGVRVVAAGEVAVVRGDDGVGLAFLHIATIPLANARTAGVGEDDTTNLFEDADDAITVDSSTDLLGTGGNREFALDAQTMIAGFLCDRRSAGHVLVRRVCARSDEADLELLWPSVLLGFLGKLRYWRSKIGSERTVDVRLEFRKVLGTKK